MQVNVQPIQRSPVPIGTVAEAEKAGLDTTQYSTCSRPNQATGHIGCPWYAKCRVSARGEAGPKNYGIEILKGPARGGDMVRTVVHCMWIADHIEDLERDGGSFKVIADEGEKFDNVTSILINSQTQQPTFQKDPLGVREMRRISEEVKPYPRPTDNESLLIDVIRAESAELERERRSDEARARNYGLESTISPIDKRTAGPDKGRKATG